MINISKEKLSKIILEETVGFLEEISFRRSGKKNKPLETSVSWQAFDNFRLEMEKNINVLKDFLSSLMDDRDKIKNEVSTIKQQIFGLEKTRPSPAPELRKLLPTQTINKQVAENKKV